MKNVSTRAADGSEIVIAFDFGLRRLGVASGNLRTRTATPLRTIAVNDAIPWPQIDELIEEWRPSDIVVGVPESSSDQDFVARVQKFVHELGIRYKLPVAAVDEFLTSSVARSALAEHRRRGAARRRTKKGDLDKLAACLIAEQWMSSQS